MIAGILRRYVTGILPRYIMGQIARSFLLAQIMLSTIFVLFVVVTKMSEVGLGPADALVIIPFAVPSTLPYTVPVALLFAVSVVYGRIASENEVIAVKSCGQSVMTVLCPALTLGAIMSVGLMVLSNEYIPRASHQARVSVYRNIEDMLYRILKKNRYHNNPAWPFMILVGDVEDRILIDANFMHRSKKADAKEPYDLLVFAKQAALSFDMEQERVVVKLVDAVIQGDTSQPDQMFIDHERLEFSLSGDRPRLDPPVQELTALEIIERQNLRKQQIREERQRQAIAASLWIGSGRVRRVHWHDIRAAHVDYEYWRRDGDKLETEKHMRIALACGAFFFVLLGAPVGIRMARGDFLSSFMLCFLPIIGLYYPLTLAGINLGKEGMVDPMFSLWTGNALLGLLSGFVLRKVRRH